MEGTGNEIFKKAGIHILLVKLEKKWIQWFNEAKIAESL
jgi:hypothetical protein